MQTHDRVRPHKALDAALALVRELSKERRDDGELGVSSARRGWCTVSVHNLVPGRRVRKQAENIYTDGTLDEMRAMLLNDVGSDEEHAAAEDSDLSEDDYSEDDCSEDSDSCSGSDSHSAAETEEEDGEGSDADPDYTPHSSDPETDDEQSAEGTTDESTDEEPEFGDSDESGDDAMDVDEPPAPAASDVAAADESMGALFAWFGGLEVHAAEWDDFTAQVTEGRWCTRPTEQADSNFFVTWRRERAGRG